MRIIVTGASRGIGRAIALSFCKMGVESVIAIARSEDQLLTLKQEAIKMKSGCELIPMTLDLSSTKSLEILLDFIKVSWSGVDILINNAGLLINKEFHKLKPDDFDSMFEVNVKSVFFLTQALLPYLKKNSHIVNISSMGGVQGSAKFSGLSLYSASKGALNVLTETLAEELKDKEIKVNGLALGAVQTEMLEKAFPDYKAPVSAEEMGEYISNFALEGHRFFNGKILSVALSTPS